MNTFTCSIFAGILFSLLSITNVQAEENIFSARVAADTSSCEQQASDLLHRFQQMTEGKGTKAVCSGTYTIKENGTDFYYHRINLFYSHNTVIDFYRQTFSLNSSPLKGFYRNYSDCLNDSINMLSVFQKETGLSVLSWFCDKEEVSWSPGYILKIESIGTPQKIFTSLKIPFLQEISAQLKSSIYNILAKYGATSLFEFGDAYYFYHKTGINFFSTTLARFNYLHQCEEQLEDVRNILKKIKSYEYAYECSLDQKLKEHYKLNIFYASPWYISTDFGTSSPRYYSYDECRDDYQRFVTTPEIKTSYAGGICREEFSRSGVYLNELVRVPLF